VTPLRAKTGFFTSGFHTKSRGFLDSKFKNVKIMTTDKPFLKKRKKAHFWQKAEFLTLF